MLSTVLLSNALGNTADALVQRALDDRAKPKILDLRHDSRWSGCVLEKGIGISGCV